MVLVGIRSYSGVDVLPSHDKYDEALNGNMNLDGRIVQLGELNEQAYWELIFSIKLVPLWESWHLTAEECKTSRIFHGKLQDSMRSTHENICTAYCIIPIVVEISPPAVNCTQLRKFQINGSSIQKGFKFE